MMKRAAFGLLLLGSVASSAGSSYADSNVEFVGGFQLGGNSFSSNWNSSEFYDLNQIQEGLQYTNYGKATEGKSNIAYGLHLGFNVWMQKSFISLGGELFWSPVNVKASLSSDVSIPNYLPEGFKQWSKTLKSHKANWAAVLRAGYKCGNVAPYIGLGYVWRPFNLRIDALFGEDVFEGKKTFSGFSPRIGMAMYPNKSMEVRLEGGVTYYKAKTFVNTSEGVFLQNASWKVTPRDVFVNLSVSYKLGMDF
jgi:hypothetical protein